MIVEHTPVRAEQIARLQQEVERLKVDNDRLREQKDQLEIQLEQYVVGADSNSERIVHLVKNPLQECIAERDNNVEKLQEEVICITLCCILSC